MSRNVLAVVKSYLMKHKTTILLHGIAIAVIAFTAVKAQVEFAGLRDLAPKKMSAWQAESDLLGEMREQVGAPSTPEYVAMLTERRAQVVKIVDQRSAEVRQMWKEREPEREAAFARGRQRYLDGSQEKSLEAQIWLIDASSFVASERIHLESASVFRLYKAGLWVGFSFCAASLMIGLSLGSRPMKAFFKRGGQVATPAADV